MGYAEVVDYQHTVEKFQDKVDIKRVWKAVQCRIAPSGDTGPR